MGRKQHRGRVKDPRSTGRKRGRKALQKSGRLYRCACTGCNSVRCGARFSSQELCGYSPQEQGRSDTLDVNHKNKNVLDNDPVNLEWLCRACHKMKDKRTEKGVAHDEETAKLYDNDLFIGLEIDDT